MFGFIYIAYGAIISSLANLSEAVRNATFRQETYDAETGLYYDSKMRCYDSTMGNRQVFLDTQNMGRMVTRDLKTFELLRDITQERMDRELKYYREHPDPNHTVVEWSTLEDEPNRAHHDDWDKPWGKRYKDIQTGAIYVKRNFRDRGDIYNKQALDIKTPFTEAYRKRYLELINKAAQYPNHDYYMDIETGMLARVVDETYKKEEELLKRECRYTDEEISNQINEEKEKDEKWIVVFNEEQKENAFKGMKELNGNRFYCNHEMTV